jgi:hypothetical protein
VEEAMAYDPEMDKVLKTWKCNETGLVVSINRYGAGEAKVQIGPRILLKDIIDEVKDEMTNLAKPA